VGDRLIRRMADLIVGSQPRRQFQIRQGNAAVNITGYQFRAELLISPDDVAAVMSIIEADIPIITAATGLIEVRFPQITVANTSGRDDARLFRIFVWPSGVPTTNPPREILEYSVAVR